MSAHLARLVRATLLVAVALALVGCEAPDPLAEARELQASGRFAASLEPLRQLLETRPDDPEVHYLNGLALLRTGEPALSLWSFRKAMETPEWRVRAGTALATAALAADNVEAAIDAATTVLELEPESVDVLLLRARARATSRRDYEGTLADADRALELDPDSAEALGLRVVALLGLERIDDAEKAIEESERRASEVDLGLDAAAHACAVRASFLAAKGEVDEADDHFAECLESYPASPLVVDAALAFYDGKRDAGRSLEVLRAAFEAAPWAAPFRSRLAARLRASGQAEEAERLLLDATEDPTTATGAWLELGAHYAELEDYAAAATAVERAVDLAGLSDPQLLFHYADLLVMAGRFERALELADQLEVPAYRELVRGRVALRRDRPAEALEHLEAGLRLWPNNAVARYYAAQAAEALGDFDRAVAEYRYSLRADPTATDARLRLAHLHVAEGNLPRALTAARHGLGRAGVDRELELYQLELAARAGDMAVVGVQLTRLMATPDRGRAVAAVADGVRAGQGAAAAVRAVRQVGRLDLTQPANADALRALVVALGEAGEPAEGLSEVESALAGHPDAAVLHALRGRALAQAGAPAAELRTAYERAVELDPEQPEALLGLGRLAAEDGEPGTALELYGRAAALEPTNPAPVRAAAELLLALDRKEEAALRLAEVLERDPYDGEAAAGLAELTLEREGGSDRALALARRAARFGGGARAEALLMQVRQRRGEAAAS